MTPQINNGDPRLEGLARFLEKEAGLEAVLVDLKTGRLSLATLGPVDHEELKRHLAAALAEIKNTWDDSQQVALHSNLSLRRIKNEWLLEKPTCPTAPLFWVWRDMPWPEAPEPEETGEEWRQLAWQAGICGLFLVLGFVLGQFFEVPRAYVIACYAVSILAGGWDAAIDAWARIKKRELDIHFLMLAVASGAVAIGAWAEGALLLFLFSLSAALEHFALHRTKREINALFQSAPKQAIRLTPDGQEQEVPVEKIVVGDCVRVKPGDVFPVDAEVLTGETAADESNLTGESIPITKRVGDEVLSGTINLWGSVDARVLRPASSSALAKIIRLIQEARHLKAPSQKFTDRFGTRYTQIILAAVVVMFVIWHWGLGLPAFQATADGGDSAFYRAMTLLVVASPCALVLSIPSAILAAIAWGARHGILFRGGAAIERLAEVKVVALDKTGTLTTGDLQVIAVESFPVGQEKEILQLAVALEQKANHPIARAILRHGKLQGVEVKMLEDFQSLNGYGIKGRYDGGVCVLGRRELLGGGKLAELVAEIPLPPGGFTEVWVLRESLLGRILLQDKIREESGAVLHELRELGLHTIMLTGDRLEVAQSVAAELEISEIRAGLKPAEKVSAIEEIIKSGRVVAMVGDGVNDAPCLAVADVGVAMGARGSDAAMEESEVVLMRDRIDLFLDAYRLSVRARSVIRQNLVISLGTVMVMVILSLGGWVTLPIGVIAHEGSTVLVCLNSLRLLFHRNKSEDKKGRGMGEKLKVES